ncbi:hypothetical protein BS50DRAFT_588471 [Corynespora cassiicola Philippines]|uniref:Uncharacterized protein n=1 Tax=Corynespora cassiicola Philippines TaxID=1448308 RepID=A0A2T2NQI1_CORCC|nr:hypothetical protein BS50DRAFT_588471 [Corynespora cassiicola Philippines]
MYGETQRFKGFKKISLHFTSRELYRLIGFECTPGTGFNIPYQPPHGPISSIADLPGLKDLDLHISISMGRKLMEEGSHETSRHDSPWIDEKTPGIRLFPCAETLLEHFLILGYDKLRLARSITFGGIPRFEREKLSVICDKSLSLEMSEKVEKIRSLPAQTLPVLRLRDPLDQEKFCLQSRQIEAAWFGEKVSRGITTRIRKRIHENLAMHPMS